ncbi:SDR family NAD(P)-dependent oxidoreductase [Mesorhizobium sp. 1B3]|uniref:SDR family NAD(P)-dependent oxidoreductase n=1 Tax=Mesorhizobium sp. 1B3 TaxID=3243599 RepID=UPI003D955973
MSDRGQQNRVVLVTGGSRGIGRAVVLRLAQTGAHIAFTYATRTDAARDTAAQARQAGAADVTFFPCDMADTKAIADLPSLVDGRWGRLDVLVNNAGLTRDGPFALLPAEQWREVLTVNLVNTIRLTEAALPMLEQTRGVVVSVSSLAGRAGKEGQVPYSATKSGLIGMTRLVARTCRQRGIRAVAVMPGFIRTDMIEGLGAKAMEPTLAGSVQPRPGEAEEVANVCAFLASNEASYLDGSAVPVDGGFRI